MLVGYMLGLLLQNSLSNKSFMKNDLTIFEDYKIRRVYDEKTETWYFLW